MDNIITPGDDRENPGGMIMGQFPVTSVMEGLRSLADELKDSL